jgi:hypothetical protein
LEELLSLFEQNDFIGNTELYKAYEHETKHKEVKNMALEGIFEKKEEALA